MPVSAVHQVLRVTHMHVPSSRWISSWCHIENQNRLSGTTTLRKGTSTPTWRTCHRGTSSGFFSALAALTGVLGLGRGYSSSFQKERKGGVGRRVYGLLRTRNRQSPLTPPPPFPSSPVQETQKEKGTLVVPQLRTTLSFTKSKVL